MKVISIKIIMVIKELNVTIFNQNDENLSRAGLRKLTYRKHTEKNSVCQKSGIFRLFEKARQTFNFLGFQFIIAINNK